MVKLNQILAVEKGKKARTYAQISEIYKAIQKGGLFTGMTRSYQPKNDDDNERLPAENVLVQQRVPELIATVRAETIEAWDITATKEWGNVEAVADIVVGGVTLVAEAPVTYLLYLEKQLKDLHAFVSTLPTLDPAETWTYDPAIDAYATGETQTHRSQKRPRVIVKYDATEQHPAQTEIFTEDEIVGFWTIRKFSGAMQAADRKAMLDRVEALMEAVKQARELANGIDVENQTVAEPMLAYIFG